MAIPFLKGLVFYICPFNKTFKSARKADPFYEED